MSKISSSKADQIKLHQTLAGGMWHDEYHSGLDHFRSSWLGYHHWKNAKIPSRSSLDAYRAGDLDCGPAIICAKCGKLMPLSAWTI